jgi:E3 ubiquitin-protein ligase UBR1
MHYSCFEAYFDATVRRHSQQIARHAPEDTSRLEFVCPLCKALGNAFLPIIWKGQEEAYPGPLVPSTPFSSFLDEQLRSAYYTLGATRPPDQIQNAFAAYTQHNMINNLAEKSSQLLDDAWVDLGVQSISTGTPFSETFSLTSVPDTGTPRTTPDVNSMVRELANVYRRLRDTLKKNGITSRHQSDAPEQDGNELYGSDALARSVGFSISAVEIQQRGADAEYGMTFLEKIPDQVLTQLRILSETVTSYIAVGGLRESGENRIDSEYRKDSERQHCQLFITQYQGEETENTRFPAATYPPLLSQDLFVFLCESVFGVASSQGFEIAHLVRLCYLAEITKVVYHLARNIPATIWIDRILNPHRQDMDPQLANFADFCEAIFEMDVACTSERFLPVANRPPMGENKAFEQPGLDTLEAWYQLVRKYALTFLRKCVILLHVKFGVDFNSRVSPNPEQRELERLTEMLRVPSLNEMLTALTPHVNVQHGWPADTPRLVAGWVRHQAQWPYTGTDESLPPSAVVSHPGIFELVGLPKNYDTLIDECTRRRCPTKGKDITDPMICLFCGDIFCGQAVCCAKDIKEGRTRVLQIGGAQQHMQK